MFEGLLPYRGFGIELPPVKVLVNCMDYTLLAKDALAARFAAKMASLNIQIRDVKHIKTHHIEKYIRSRQAEGISTRTLQNEMAAVRNILITGGRGKLADPQHEKLSNKALWLSGASRDGTKVAISAERYLAADGRSRDGAGASVV